MGKFKFQKIDGFEEQPNNVDALDKISITGTTMDLDATALSIDGKIIDINSIDSSVTEAAGSAQSSLDILNEMKVIMPIKVVV